MKNPLSPLVAAAAALVLVTACGSEESSAASSNAVYMTWPQDGWTMYEDVDFVFGGGGGARFALLVDAEPMPAGQKLAANLLLPEGATRHTLKLSPGPHQVTLQKLGADATSAGPDQAVTASFEVKKTPEALGVAFLEPAEGAQVKSPFKVKFGLTGMSLEPALIEANVPNKTSGHHHILIDSEPTPVGVVIPADEKHLHYGKAQTEAEISLPPGKHTLTMQYADTMHQSYGPAMAATITVEVVE